MPGPQAAARLAWMGANGSARCSQMQSKGFFGFAVCKVSNSEMGRVFRLMVGGFGLKGEGLGSQSRRLKGQRSKVKGEGRRVKVLRSFLCN